MAKEEKRGISILGFRSGKKWKKIIASVYYVLVALMLFALISTRDASFASNLLIGLFVLALIVPILIGIKFRPKSVSNDGAPTQAEKEITAEKNDDNNLRKQLRELQIRYDTLYKTLNPDSRGEEKVREDVQVLRDELETLQKQIIAAEETIEMESFSLYRPKYGFATSDEYKDRLEKVRTAQKEMIKNKTAATCSTEWTVNGSKAEGRKQTEDNIKLFLRSFNNECDIAISDVRFSNFDRCEARIQKSYETINKLGRVSNISISPRYLTFKMDELHLAHEYALKKQQEKEEQAEIRRQQREQAKLEKEIAEARKAAEKEKQHNEQAVSNIEAQIFACTDAEERAALEARREEIKNGLASVEDKLADIDYRQSNQRAGYVYIISNIGAFGENVYKIGMTRRLNPMERVDELGDASVPFSFDVHAMIFSADAPALEAALHHAFDDRRVNKVNLRREYFRVSLDEIKEVVRKNHDKTVEFVDVAAAEQYRESLKM